MSDPILTLLAGIMFIGGLLFCVLLRRFGWSRDAARDALHVGVVLWTLLVGRFTSPVYPDMITGIAFGLVLVVPVLSSRLDWVKKIQSSVAGGPETWTGIVVYVFSYTCLTWIFPHFPGPALTAMAALSLGDGLGGLIGRVFGRIRYKIPWSKPRSLEGSIAVAMGTILGATILKGLLPGMTGVTWTAILIAGVLASLAEALSPKSLDNIFVPLTAFLTVFLMI